MSQILGYLTRANSRSANRRNEGHLELLRVFPLAVLSLLTIICCFQDLFTLTITLHTGVWISRNKEFLLSFDFVYGKLKSHSFLLPPLSKPLSSDHLFTNSHTIQSSLGRLGWPPTQSAGMKGVVSMPRNTTKIISFQTSSYLGLYGKSSTMSSKK